jgi:beta-hydroxyacyl-ACP dehydratase FabZ
MSDNTKKRTATLADIKDILPHRYPFLFVDRIVEFTDGQSIVTEYTLSDQEEFLKGHFPGRPIMPGVLISEALAQTCGLLVGLATELNNRNNKKMLPVFALASIDIKFRQAVLPESRLLMQALLQKKFGGMYRFSVKASVNKSVVAQGILTLGKINAQESKA